MIFHMALNEGGMYYLNDGMQCASLQFFCLCNKTLIHHYNGIVRPDCTQQNEVLFHQMILFVGTTNWLFPWFDNYLGLNDENW